MKQHALLIVQPGNGAKKAAWEQLREKYHLFYSKSRSRSVFYLTHEPINCIITESPRTVPICEDQIIYYRGSFQTIPLVVYGQKEEDEAGHGWWPLGCLHCVPSGRMNKLVRSLPEIGRAHV